jgi:hypothetical protein
MKGIIFGIIVSLLLLASTISTAQQHTQPSTPVAPLDDDAPEWQVGNSWTYTVNNLTINYNVSGQKVLVNGRIDDFTWTVTDISGSTYYTVNFTGKLTASYDLKISSVSGNIQLKGTFKKTFTRLKGTILFTKSDLQVHDVTMEVKGLTVATIGPLKIPLPLLFKVTAHGGFSDDFPLLDFPLTSNKYWSLPNIDITMQANAGGILGIIQFPISFTTQYSWTPFAFHCQDKRDVTVPAGTFSAYKISSLLGDYFEYYYAPDVGNIIKINATLQNGAVSAELIATNYF